MNLAILDTRIVEHDVQVVHLAAGELQTLLITELGFFSSLDIVENFDLLLHEQVPVADIRGERTLCGYTPHSFCFSISNRRDVTPK